MWGVWGQTYHIRDVNIGGGPCVGGVTGGMGAFGESYGGCLYHKGLGCFETDIGYVNIVGGRGPEAETGNFNIQGWG